MHQRFHKAPKAVGLAKMLVPKNPDEAKAFNYGVLDFARKICKARNPNCNVCPIADICDYCSKSKMPQ